MTNLLVTATNVPAAACPRCGGWTSMGGCSQYANSLAPVHGRIGCICHIGTESLRVAQANARTCPDIMDLSHREVVLNASPSELERSRIKTWLATVYKPCGKRANPVNHAAKVIVRAESTAWAESIVRTRYPDAVCVDLQEVEGQLLVVRA